MADIQWNQNMSVQPLLYASTAIHIDQVMHQQSYDTYSTAM